MDLNKYYDSDIQSVNLEDFESDNEPPQDIIKEKKLLKKEKMLRIHKTILQKGYNLPKPAKFDIIKYKLEKT